MINGLGVLGWGVGGIEAEAAMLGQPMSMLIPQVVGFKLDGELPEGATATDLVLTVTQMLREHGVVGKFVEFYGARRPDACRSPTARRSATWRRSSARPARSSRSTPRRCATSSSPGARAEQIALVEAYAQAQGLWHDEDSEEPTLLRDARARPRRRRALAGRPEAPAGPRRADRVQGRVPGGARGLSLPGATAAPGTDDDGGRRVVPGLRPAVAQRPRRLDGARAAARPRGRAAAGRSPSAARTPTAAVDAR